MIHETSTEVTHQVTFTDEEATALGQWLLDMHDSDRIRASMSIEVQELVSDLANCLNGVA